LLAAINGLDIGGGTNMAEGLRTAATALDQAKTDRYILLFTDGMPDSQPDALAAASACQSSGARIVAVATGDANTGYLAQLTRDPALVFAANAGQFAQAFQHAEKAIYSRQLVESHPSGVGFFLGVIRIAIWTSLLAIGAGLGLIASQNLYLHRPALTKPEAIRGAIGSAVAGLVAGAAGQMVFASASQAPAVLVGMGRIVGWALVGLLLGLGISRFVPNLKPIRGLAGGALGGAIGAIGFLLIGLLLGDAAGRLVGAAIVGFFIGAMIALLEVVLREAWLEVEYGPTEIRTVSLGRQPVTLGSDSSQCTVYLAGVAPVALRCSLEDGKVLCEEPPAGPQFLLSPGDNRRLGKATIRVRAATPPSHTGGPAAKADARSQKPTLPLDPVSEPSDSKPHALASGTLYLRIRAQRIALPLGAKLRAQQIPGVEAKSPDEVVAEVVANPNDPSVLGLKNLSGLKWEALPKEGSSNRIEAGRSARLAIGTKIRFGATEAVIEEGA
jgi:Ca-activated chloride channel family protein